MIDPDAMMMEFQAWTRINGNIDWLNKFKDNDMPEDMLRELAEGYISETVANMIKIVEDGLKIKVGVQIEKKEIRRIK